MIVFWGHNNFLIWAQSLRFNLFAHFAVAVAPRLHSTKAYFQLVNWFSICLSLSMCFSPAPLCHPALLLPLSFLCPPSFVRFQYLLHSSATYRTPTRPCHANANINSSSVCHLPLCSFMTGTGTGSAWAWARAQTLTRSRAWACSDSCLELAFRAGAGCYLFLICRVTAIKLSSLFGLYLFLSLSFSPSLCLCASQLLGNILNANAICTNESKILIALGAWRTIIKQLCSPTYQCPI